MTKLTKPTKKACAPSQGIRPVWSGSLLSAWRNHGSFATHWAHSEDTDQTGRMPRPDQTGRMSRLISVFAGHSHFVGFVMRCSYLERLWWYWSTSEQVLCSMKLSRCTETYIHVCVPSHAQRQLKIILHFLTLSEVWTQWVSCKVSDSRVTFSLHGAHCVHTSMNVRKMRFLSYITL